MDVFRNTGTDWGNETMELRKRGAGMRCGQDARATTKTETQARLQGASLSLVKTSLCKELHFHVYRR